MSMGYLWQFDLLAFLCSVLMIHDVLSIDRTDMKQLPLKLPETYHVVRSFAGIIVFNS